MPLWNLPLARTTLGLPPWVTPVAVVPLGWPRGHFGPTTRPPVETVVHVDQWGNLGFQNDAGHELKPRGHGD